MLCQPLTDRAAAAPLPKFDGGALPQPPQLSTVQPIVPQNSGQPSSPTSGPPPVRVPALGPDKVAEYSALFEKSGAENGLLSGLIAKQIFERARLPNEVLGRIWNLADVQGKGSLDVSEFVVAMHLLASYKAGSMKGVPNTLPPGLLDAASRRPPTRFSGPPRPSSAAGQPLQPIPQQFTGQIGGRPQSPIVRQQMGTPLSTQSTGEQWLIGPADKQRFDQVFSTVDTNGQGFISGEQAVQFFGNTRLPEEVLAQIWDLADINSDGVLNRDEFAVAMYLIRQQRGTRDGRLPQTLPAGLVPPSMRKQQMPSQPSTVPVFDDAPVTKPRSAADDLFGLDVSDNAPPQPQPQPPQASQQIPQSTGIADAGAFASPKPPPAQSSSPPPSTFFQPFVPKSSYGQGLMPQSTGTPTQAQPKSQPDRDLMDSDDEAPSKINNDAAELGNLSNQIGNLSKQMTDLQGQRGQAEQELTQNANQKRAFQERLTQLRAAYDQEVKAVKSLKDQLAASQAETKRLLQDMAMIEGTHTDLKTQHQQLSSALVADQKENASLKERIRQTNAENEQLKPQLEKLKSDARQQKGLVAINRKQLATNETERDRIRAEMAAAQKELEESRRETEETARHVQASQKELEQAKEVPIPAPVPREFSPPPQVASPALSTGSSNPFFRRQDSGAVFSPAMGSAITSPAPDHERNAAFDSIFGPSFGAPASVPAPATSFGRDLPDPEARSETPKVVEPPAPEPAHQIESSALPLRAPLGRESSTSSSVQVAPPASRLSPVHTPHALTPDTSTASPSSHRADDPFASSAVDEQQESVRQTLPRGETSEKMSAIPGGFPEESRSSTPAVNPTAVAVGAGAATLAAGAGIAAAAATQSDGEKGKAPNISNSKDDFDNFFEGPSHKKTLSEQRADFDSAFEGFDAPAKPATAAKASNNSEFPDIHEFDDDDDDSSDESEEEAKGFDDNFTAPVMSPPQSTTAAGKQPDVASAVPNRLQATPSDSRISSSSSLPGFDQQQSPPGYKDAVPDDNPNNFPREYKNLLPEREDPTSPSLAPGGSNQPGPNPAGTPPSYGPEIGHSSSVTKGETAAAAPFDFDSAFQNMGQAPIAADDESDSEYGDRTPGVLRHQAQSFDFDPSFDSPAHSALATSASQQQSSISDAITSPTTNGAATSPARPTGSNAFSDFQEFNSNPFPPSRTGTLQSQPAASPTAAKAASASHDWDSLFAPLDAQAKQDTSRAASASSPPTDDNTGAPLLKVATSRSVSQSTQIGHDLAATTTHQEIEEITPPGSQQQVPTVSTASSPPPTAASPASKAAPAPKPERPKPGRALTEGTEHDDPILKSLTAMGWSRSESLAALERFDYNIDKVSELSL